MKTSIVLGLGFGDEGKGLVTSALAQQIPNTVVVRYGGGHQCGHTVIREDGLKHVFANFGSGSLHNVPTYWSKFCTIDPVGMKVEYELLKKKGVTPKLYIHPEAMVTTPYDISWNQFTENQLKHGSCGVGFGQTIQRNKEGYSLTAFDLLYKKIFTEKMDIIKNYYGEDFIDEVYYKLDYHPIPFMEAVEWLNNCPDITIEQVNLNDYDHVVFEGHQGTLLDQKYGFFPHVTYSNTTIKNIFKLGYDINPEVFYVTRVYQTRHGNGPMSNENKQIDLINNKDETNVLNKYQGKFRTGILDIDLLKYALHCNRLIHYPRKERLVVTCVDQLSTKWMYTEQGSVLSKEIDGDVWAKSLSINDVFFSYSPITENLRICQTTIPQTISYGPMNRKRIRTMNMTKQI